MMWKIHCPLVYETDMDMLHILRVLHVCTFVCILYLNFAPLLQLSNSLATGYKIMYVCQLRH